MMEIRGAGALTMGELARADANRTRRAVSLARIP